jgi:hypothetical protein
VIGRAGASAQSEFDRRSARDRAARPDVILRHAISAVAIAVAIAVLFEVVYHSSGIGVGILFAVLYFLGRIGPRMTTTAWSTGANGELRTAAQLDPLASKDFVIMHDLKVPMSRANIDHLVIGPTGIFVVETKNVQGKVRFQGAEVRMGGRRVGVIEEVGREVAAVENALAPLLDDMDLAVNAVVCVHRADLPWFQRSVAGTRFVYPNHLAREITKRPIVLTPEQIAWLRALAEQRLPPRGT